MRAIKDIVNYVNEELNKVDQWTAFCLKVTSLLRELRALKTLGNC